ncbi:unnamed protein product [Rotaria magnacalcarata]|uniref:Uncharacterized protein n=1 Tax=Rotaria magnacalcarata TaxID=392030 RepID=A0A819MEY3_9BILA|nr:unnamed protein product [Rotaria magnacalcarata]CAF4205487.1 unnamed protein product [Rotaria magnacalcarata]
MVDIIGTLNTRNRHVRIDFQDETEYNTILNSGKVSIYGQLTDCDQRCGKDRNDKEDHSLCEIKCHHCDGPHTSTDYSCSFIQQYRRELVLELRNRSDLLPAEFKKNQNQHYHPFNRLSSDYKNQWASLPHSSSDSHTPISNNNLNGTIKSLKDELNLLKENYASEQTKIEEKYKKHLISMNQCWLIMQQQIQTQTEMFTSMDSIINSIVFSTCTRVMETLSQLSTNKKMIKIKMNLNLFFFCYKNSSFLLMIKKSTYISHQIKSNRLAEKQREVLDLALNSIINQPNGL